MAELVEFYGYKEIKPCLEKLSRLKKGQIILAEPSSSERLWKLPYFFGISGGQASQIYSDNCEPFPQIYIATLLDEISLITPNSCKHSLEMDLGYSQKIKGILQFLQKQKSPKLKIKKEPRTDWVIRRGGNHLLFPLKNLYLLNESGCNELANIF